MFRQLRCSFRSLHRSPGHSLTVILALAFGIGLSVAIFGLVEAMLMRPFAFPRLDQVVAIFETVPSAGAEWYATSPANFLDWQQTATSFSTTAAYRRWSAALTTASGGEAVAAYNVSPTFFSLTEVEPLLGTAFSTQGEPDSTHIVVSYRFWKNRLGADPNIIGRSLTINQSPYIVIAVMPESFDFPIAAEAWAPLVFTPAEKVNRTDRRLGVLARLKPNVSVGRAEQEMSAIATRLVRQYPTENASWGAKVVLLRQSVNRYANKFLIILMIAVSVLLLLACVNVANLQLARGAMRRKELAVKIALGADRRRVIADVVAENLLFSLVAAGIGIPIAYATLKIIKASVTGAVVRNAAGLMNAEISFPVLWFALALAALSAFFVALPSIFQSAEVNLTDVLNADGRGSSGSVRRGLRSVLVGSQIALATFLLIAAATLITSFVNLVRAPLGYDPHNLVIYHSSLSARDYPEPSRVVQFYDEAMRRVREIPGTAAASVVSELPSLDESDTANVFRAGDVDLARPYPAEMRTIGPDYFRTLAIRVTRGREFLDSDNAQEQPVAIVSAAVARRLWADQDPLGRRVVVGPENRLLVVVGVVSDVNHFLLEHDTRPTIYRPLAQAPTRSMYVVFRSHGPVEPLLSQARSAIAGIDGNDRVYEFDTFEGILTDVSGGVRVVATLLLVVGIIALILAFAGIYAVLSYLIAVQSRDIAIRISLGATPRRIVAMFLAYLFKVVVPSLMFGVVAGLAFGRLLSRVISAMELTPSAVAMMVAVVLCASVIATLVPARRIAMISPADAARNT